MHYVRVSLAHLFTSEFTVRALEAAVMLVA